MNNPDPTEFLKKELILARAELSLAQKRLKDLETTDAWQDRVVLEFGDLARGTIRQVARIATDPIKPQKIPRVKGTESAILAISDSHVGKIINPENTLGFGNYSPEIFLRVLWTLEKRVTQLLTQEWNRTLRRLHIVFLGDLVDGALDHSSEKASRDLVAEQCLFAAIAFHQFIRRLSAIVDVSVIGAAVGNHGRLPNQKKTPTDGRHSNFDWIVMGMIQALLEGCDVPMLMHRNPFWVEDIEGWRFHFGHGDHLRGGDKAMGVPAHAIGRQINATTQRYAARGERPPDYYIVGDKHRPLLLPTATGRFLINGSFFEGDSYALISNFPPVKPHQLLFGVHPKEGRSWSYDVNLADPEPDHPYRIPEYLSHLASSSSDSPKPSEPEKRRPERKASSRSRSGRKR